MKEIVADALDRLSRVEGVRGALVVDTQAGVPVSVVADDELDRVGLSALATHFFTRLSRAAGAAGYGEAITVRLNGDTGQLVITSSGELLVLVVAEAGAELEPLRHEARLVAEVLR